MSAGIKTGYMAITLIFNLMMVLTALSATSISPLTMVVTLVVNTIAILINIER